MLLVESLKALKPGTKMLTVSFQQLDTDFLNNQCSACFIMGMFRDSIYDAF